MSNYSSIVEKILHIPEDIKALEAEFGEIDAARDETVSARTETLGYRDQTRTYRDAAAAAATTATAKAAQILDAVEAVGPYAPFYAKSDADNALAAGELAEGDHIRVFNDDTQNGATATYKVVNEAFVLEALFFPKKTELLSASLIEYLSIDVPEVSVLGYDAAGDGGAAIYRRVNSEPTHDCKRQTPAGTWYELSPSDGVIAAGAAGVRPEIAAYDRAAQNSDAFDRCASFAAAYPGTVFKLPAGRITFDRPIPMQSYMGIVGSGLYATRLVKNPTSDLSRVISADSLPGLQVSNLKVIDERGDKTVNQWSQMQFVGCTDLRVERIVAEGCQTGVIGLRHGCTDFVLDTIIARDCPNTIIGILGDPSMQRGEIKNIFMRNCWEAVDFGGNVAGPHLDVTITNVWGINDTLVNEEMFDLGSCQGITIEKVRAHNYKRIGNCKNEPADETGHPWRNIVFRDVVATGLSDYAFALLNYLPTANTDPDNSATGVLLDNVRISGGKGLITSWSGGATNVTVSDITLRGVRLDGCERVWSHSFGALSNVRLDDVRVTNPTAVNQFDLGRSGAAGGADNWKLRDVYIDGAPLVLESVNGIDIKGVEVLANDTHAAALQLTNCQRVRVREFELSGSGQYGIEVVTNSPSYIDQDRFQDIVIADGTMRQVCQDATKTGHAGVRVAFTNSANAGQMIYGLTVRDTRVFENGPGNTQSLVSLSKGQYASIAAVNITNIVGVGLTGDVIAGDADIDADSSVISTPVSVA